MNTVISQKEFHEVVYIWPKMQPEEFAKLVDDIKARGLREPVWLYQGKIIDGRHRYLACLEAGIEPHYQEWDGQGSLVLFVASLNQHRRHLDAGQKAMVALKLEEELAKEAAKRKVEAGKLYGEGHTKPQEVVEMFQQPLEGRSAVQAAKLTGTNAHYVVDAKKIAQQAPELKEMVMNRTVSLPDAKKLAEIEAPARATILEKITTGQAKKVKEAVQMIKREEKQEYIAQLREKGADVPIAKYSCLVVDPPWPMQKIEREVRPNQVEFDYPTMSEEELRAFPLPDIAADNCHLYLWTTQKYLPMALSLATHWGFRYQCLLTWVKNVGFTPFSWMYSTEHILFCTRGSLPLLKIGTRLDFAAKVREHSRKPDEFYEIVKMVSPGPRIDVFSREKRDGFEQYGNEVERFV